jgi:nucleoid-associated protein YgaU
MLKPSGETATAAAGVALNVTGAWPSGKTTAPSVAVGVALVAGELAGGEPVAVADGVGEPVGLAEAGAAGAIPGVDCPALRSVTPGAPAGPQKACPSLAAGPTAAGSSAGAGEADGLSGDAGWVPKSMVTSALRVWPSWLWTDVLGIVTW